MKKIVSIHKHIFIIGNVFLYSLNIFAQEQKIFSNINEILDFTKNNNYQFKNAEWQTKLADLTSKTAMVNVFNPKIPTSLQVLDNFNQQVSFLPGQAFGQPEGTFREITMGQQYVSTFSIQPQFDILNLANYAQLNTAKTNQLLVENQNKLNEQNLYERINMVYFNIVSFNAQKEIVKENITIAADIFKIIENKFKAGIARKQEVNEAQVNLISLQDKLQQIELNTNIQYQSLNLFLDNKANAVLSENVWIYEKSNEILKSGNNLIAENAKLQLDLAKQEYRGLKFQNYPVLSFVSSFNWQNLSDDFAFAKKSSWIDYSYIGLKLSYDLPTTVQKYSNLKSKQMQIKIAENNEIYNQKETENKNILMVLEYEKAIKQKENYCKIYELKKDTYEKNFNQFKENILPLDKLLISQNDMLISKLNIVLSLASIGFNKTKIDINNRF